MRKMALAYGPDGTTGDSGFIAESYAAVEVEDDATWDAIIAEWLAEKGCDARSLEQYAEEWGDAPVGFWLLDADELAAIDQMWIDAAPRGDSGVYRVNAVAKSYAKRHASRTVVQE